MPYLEDERSFSFLINLVGASSTGIVWFLKEPYNLSDSVIVDGVFDHTFRGKTETNYPKRGITAQRSVLQRFQNSHKSVQVSLPRNEFWDFVIIATTIIAHKSD